MQKHCRSEFPNALLLKRTDSPDWSIYSTEFRKVVFGKDPCEQLSAFKDDRKHVLTGVGAKWVSNGTARCTRGEIRRSIRSTNS
jgi:hypothetical protein